MKYLLDTNTCIRHLNQRSPSITRRLHALPETDIVLCSVVKAELYTGAMKSNAPEKTFTAQQAWAERFQSLPFDDGAVMVYARIRAGLEQVGRTIGGNDLLIAAIAIANDLTLVTHNTREFSRVAGLRLEDWEAEDR
jgi:tRNA(fMet)-specific endonuclease VapC